MKPAAASRNSLDIAIVAGVVILGAIALFLLLTNQRQQLRSAPTGLDGLVLFLNAEDEPAFAFTGGWGLPRDEIGLRILPLYDTDLRALREPPETTEDFLTQQDEFDIALGIVRRKLETVPTMLVLPKWRTVVRATGLGHPAFAVERERLDTILANIAGAGAGTVLRPDAAFLEIPMQGSDLRAALYAPQLFTGPGCRPLLGEVGAMLAGVCPLDGLADDVVIVSDPDLLNNHGLRLGDNAFIVRDLVAGLAKDGRTMVDYSTDQWILEGRDAPARERTWADLARFLDYPFSVMWFGGALCLAIALLRAAIRNAPPRATDFLRPGASREVALGNRARLMRMTGQSGAMLADYVGTRLSAAARARLGSLQGSRFAGEEAFLRSVARDRPDLARALYDAVAAIRGAPDTLSAGEAIGLVDEFETILNRIEDDT
ncbi:MAG: hypothetical protein ACPGID_08375 [Rubricella sp.]